MPRIKEQFEAMRSTTKQKIITAGLQLFSYRGLAATSIQDIAAQAGISTGLMYHYYRSKEALFQELVLIAVDSANDSARVIFLSDQSPAEKIRRFTHDVLTEIEQGDEIGQFYLLMTHAILGSNLKDPNGEIAAKRVAALAWLQQTLIEGQARGEVRAGPVNQMALLYFAAIQGLAIYKLTLGDQFATPQLDMLNNLLLV